MDEINWTFIVEMLMMVVFFGWVLIQGEKRDYGHKRRK